MTLPAGTQIGKYIVRKKLAEGGMAEIYLATSQGAEGFEKEVVIKRVRSFLASDPGFVDMFIAEARLASRLNHANVVQIFDFEKHEDTYYLAMEYVRGCTLWDLRKKCKELMEPMPAVLVAHIGAEVARGLHYAHRLKVNGEPLFLVHRDVTPHNVLLSFDGAVKLTDFGIAKAGNKLTSPGMLKGKFAYMSPEQSRGEQVDVRTDVFALGIVLWEMLTGGRLFEGDSELAVLRAVQQSVIPHPARLNPDVPEEVGGVVMKALERDPEARFQTAGELERALVQCVLNHARSPDDTDVAAFVRRVYIGGVASALALPAVPERTQRLEAQKATAEPEPVPREPTAVLPGPRGRRSSTAGGGEGRRPTPSPDEDVHAPTHLLPPRGEGSSGGRPSPEQELSLRPTESALPTVTPSSERIPAVAASPGGRPEAPEYPATVSLSAPASSSAPAARRESPSPSMRLGLGVGLAVLALFAAVGIVSLVRSPTQGEARPDVSRATPVEPPPPVEPPRVVEAAPDAGTAVDAGVLAVEPPAVPEPERTVEKKPPAPKAPARGSLTLSAQPYATVFMDGKYFADVQGVKTFKVNAGSYQITFQHPKNSRSEKITIAPNGVVRLEFRAR